MSNKSRGRMNQPLRQPPTQEQQEAMKRVGEGLGGLFKGRQQPYTPITKSLEQIGIGVNIQPVMIGEDPVDCVVIPVNELIYKEWQHMTGGNLIPQDEREDSEDDGAWQASPEVGGPSDVSGGTDQP